MQETKEIEMPQKRRKENRANNRIQKRRAELDLLGNKDSECVGKHGCSQITDTKRAKGMTEENSVATPAASVFSITDISRTTEAVRIYAGDDATEKARELSKELRKQRPKSVVFESKLQLHKLNGKTLSERELAAFLHRQMLGSLNTPNRAGANWLRFEGGRKPLQIVLIRVNCDDSEMLRTNNNAKFIDEYFGFKWVRLHQSVCNRNRFWHTIATTTHSLRQLLIRKIQEFGDPLLSMRMPERKAQLLMSLADMTLARYPFPTDVFNETQNPKIRSTRKTYRRVNECSPIFVIDCEMCLTLEQRLELTRISMVNEAGETLIDELVKPYNKIIDYISFKSGITEQMLCNVNTRLKDIQKRFCALLTDDAILCGHSLENDLLALQLSHPFCIDTSLLFNFSGRSFVRSGLKALADIFLNEKIQNSRQGHCSLQDAQATLKLLKLKLEKGLVFGNVSLGWSFSTWAAENGMSIHGTRLETKERTAETTEEQEANLSVLGMSTTGEEQMPEEAVDEHVEAKAVQRTTTLDEEEKRETDDDNKKESREEEKTEKKDSDQRTTTLDEEEKRETDDYSKKESREEEKAEKQDSDNSEARESANGETKKKAGGGNASNNEERKEREHRNDGKEKKAVEEKTEFFDFNEAIRIDNAMQQTSTLSDCYKSVYGVRYGKKMLVVGKQMDKFFQHNKSCVLKELGDAGELSSHCADLAPTLMEYEVALFDLHCPAGMDKRELDDAFRHLVGGMCNNSFCLLLMVGLSSKEEDKPIMYQRVHQRTTDKGDDDGTTTVFAEPK